MYQLKLFKIKIKYQHLFTFFIYNLIMLHVLFLFHLVINNLIKLCVLRVLQPTLNATEKG